MYADKTSAACTVTGGCLALTGMDVAQVIFWVISAAVLIISGLTLFRLTRTNPKSIDDGVE